MIDFERLNAAYENRSFYSLQLEVGDVCYQRCIYCYMNALDEQRNTLSDDQIETILKDANRLGITAVEWLGGEPLLRNSIFEHMAMASDLGMRNNVWTGGLPLADDEVLEKTVKFARKGLISVHVSTVNQELYERLHPGSSRNDLATILNSVRAILDAGYPNTQMLNSVTFTGLQTAEDMIETIDFFEKEFGIKTSLNVYHTYLRPGTPIGELQKFIPSPDAVEKVYARYARQWGAKELPMNCVNKQYCSATLAILCDGSVTPCATIREEGAPKVHDKSLYEIANENREKLIFAPFRERRKLPEDCQTCRLSDRCFGCRSRSYAAGKGLYGKDPRCFRRKHPEDKDRD